MGKKSLLKGGVIGVVVGAVTGILFAPKSGKETRQDIKDKAAKANKEAEKKLKELHAELKVKTDEANVLVNKAKGKASEEAADLAKRAEFTKEKISELISAVRNFEAEDSEVEKALNEGKKLVKKITDSTSDSKNSKSK